MRRKMAMARRNQTSNRSSVAGQAHAAVRAKFHVYVEAVLIGKDPVAAYPDIAAHVAGCAACRRELKELLDLTLTASEGQVAPAPHYPQVDLSFLRPRGEPARVPRNLGLRKD